MDQKLLLVRLYLEALSVVLEEGFGEEVIRDRLYPSQNEFISELAASDFLNTYAWVVFVSGFKERIINDRWNKLTTSFRGWNPIEISDHEKQIFKESSNVLNSSGKVNAIIKCSKIISEQGWDQFKLNLLNPGYMNFLDGLPYVGEITKYHLAKYVGYNIAKPDRHMTRLSKDYGYGNDNSSVQSFARDVAIISGERVRVIDTVLWRACVIGSDLSRVKIIQDIILDDLWESYQDTYLEFWQEGIEGKELIAEVTLKYPEIIEKIKLHRLLSD